MNNFISHIGSLGRDILDLLYPDTCVACDLSSAIRDDVFCIACKSEVLYTDHFHTGENEMLFRMNERIKVKHGAALLYFLKHGKVQKAIHKLKYGKRGDIGRKLGVQFGLKMHNSGHFQPVDIIIPIPLHPRREWERGYNQSQLFAEGISSIIDARVGVKHLIKTRDMKSQTHKERGDRFENVLHSFELKNKEKLKGKSILLTDDVLTTGATIEAATEKLSQIPDITIQLGLIAMAND